MSEKPMSKVCLTPKQQKFFNYFVNYQKENGMLPTPSQATRDLRADGVKCSGGSIYQMYGALFLKGAFTGGSSLTQGYRKLHGVANTAVDVKALKFQPKAKPAPGAVGGSPTVGKKSSLPISSRREPSNYIVTRSA